MWRLAHAMRARGWEVIFTSEHWPNGVVPPATVEGIPVHSLSRSFRFQPLSYWKARDAIAALDADVFYQRGMNVYAAACAGACRALGRPMIWAASMATLMERQPFLADRGQDSPTPPQRALRAMRGAIEWRQMRWAISQARLRLAQSEDQRRFLNEVLGVEAEVLPNGVPLPEGVAEKAAVFTVVWVANMKPIKRPHLLADIAEKVARLAPSVRFEVAGRPDDEAAVARLRQLANTRLLGELSMPVADEAIGRAHLLLNTSQTEGYPNTFIQAWLRRTGVISLRADPDGVLGGQGLGWMTQDSAEEAAQRIVQLAGRPEEMEPVLDRAEAVARDRHDLQKVTGRLESLIAERFGLRS